MFKSVFCDIIFAMNRKIDYKINENDTGKTVEGFLKEHGYTHQVLVRLKQTDHGILRNGVWAYTNESARRTFPRFGGVPPGVEL